MPNNDKIYTIEITGEGMDGSWYNSKVGCKYEAILSLRTAKSTKQTNAIQFKVSNMLFVPQGRCKIIGERMQIVKKEDEDEEIKIPFERPPAVYSNSSFQ